MTPQAFSYGSIGQNGMLYLPPYGLHESIDYMLKIDPNTYTITKIKICVDSSVEKWQHGIVFGNKIFFLPYNESKVLIVDTDDDSIRYIDYPAIGKGKHIKGHIHEDNIISLPYGEHEIFDFIVSINAITETLILKKIECSFVDQKKWHTSQYLNGKIYAAPRGEKERDAYFPFAIELDCNTLDYKLTDLSNLWEDYDQEIFTNKKYTTLAKSGEMLYAPPYSENPNFDILLRFNGTWHGERMGLQSTSRKYYSHTVAINGKIYFPPAGHDTDWSEMLVIDPLSDSWKIIDLNLGKESKKYFTGWENSLGKIYYIPRGGCVCEPTDQWKSLGDLAEVLVIDTLNDSYYTIDISEHFIDNTSIEKYNSSMFIDDKIFAMPYGQSDSFQTMLIFDTLSEQVIKTIDLNVI